MIKCGRMAGSAGNFAFPPVCQGEGVAEKAGRLPGSGRVAGGAIQTKQAGMYLRFSMAGDTVAGRAGKNLSLMTTRAISDSVLSFQGPDGGVIKVCHAINAVMASQTVVAKLGDVRRHESGVCLSMTGSAISHGKCKLGSRVAARAGKGSLVIVGNVARQAKTSIAGMVENSGIERGWEPAIGCMASGALQAKQPAMLIGFSVTGGAFGGRPFKNAGIMAASTGCLRMKTSQGKTLGVIFQGEVRQGIQAIVTSQAICAKVRQMRFHEFWLFLLMAIQTRSGVHNDCALGWMAGSAAQGRAGIIQFMLRQAKIGHAVVKIVFSGGSQIKILTLVFLMATSASGCVFKTTVQPLPRAPLVGYMSVAIFTARSFDTLKRGMALGTGVLKIGMTEKAAYFFPANVQRRKMTRVKGSPTCKPDVKRQSGHQDKS